MNGSSLSREHVGGLVALYLTMTHDGGYYLDPHDRELAVQLARRWTAEPASVEDLVDTTFMAVRSGAAPSMNDLAHRLCDALPEAVCHELLSDLGRLALANGHASRQMAEAIRQVRAIWVRPGGNQAAAA